MEFIDRENGLKTVKERQWKEKTEKMDLIKRKNDSGNRRQGELTKERGGTTAEIKDRENDLRKGKNDTGNKRQRKWT